MLTGQKKPDQVNRSAKSSILYYTYGDNNNKADAMPSETLDEVLTGLRVSAIALIFMCCSVHAEILIEIGPNFTEEDSTESVTLLIQKRWQDKYAVGLGYISPQLVNTCGRPDCQWDIPEQFMIGVERIFLWRRLSFGIGLYYVDGVHRISSANLNARSSIALTFTDQFAVKFSHLSNGGLGRDITICNDVVCLTDKFNLGMNTITLVWRF